MNRYIAILMFCMAFALMSCSAHRQTAARSQVEAGTRSLERLAVADSTVLTRLKSLDFKNPRLLVIRRAPDDTTIVVFKADSVTLSDSISAADSHLSSDSIVVNAALSAVTDSSCDVSVKSSPHLSALLWVAVLLAVIVLSLRGIGSRR